MSSHQRMPYFVETFSWLQHESTLPRHQSNPTHEIFKDLEGRSNNQIWNYGLKYWSQRHNLFSKFDLGIQTDLEGLYSVTPEALAKHQASRCKGGSTIVDAFTGIGGNAIQFALMGHRVTAIDINPSKIEYAKHNARIYGVEHLIDFKVGDFFELASTLKKADVVFLSPPWGGPDYRKLDNYDISMLQPKNGTALFKAARNISQNIMLFVPRNTSVPQLQALSYTCQTHNRLRCEVEHNFIHGGSKGITAYYGQDFVPQEKKLQILGGIKMAKTLFHKRKKLQIHGGMIQKTSSNKEASLVQKIGGKEETSLVQNIGDKKGASLNQNFGSTEEESLIQNLVS